MSRMLYLNDKISATKDFNFKCLDSHHELTFMLEYKDKLIYANIYDVMVTHDLSEQYKNNKVVSDVIGQVKDLLGDLNKNVR